MATEADILNSLNLGSSKEVLKNNPSSPLAKLMRALVDDVIVQLTKSIDKYDISASNHLKQNMKPTAVTVDGDGLTVGITSDFYWKFLNYGVNGSAVNRGAPNWGKQPTNGLSMSANLKNWERDRGIVKVKGVYTNWTSKSHIPNITLTERGQIARPYFSDVVNKKLISELQEPIQKVLGRAIKIRILEPWQ